MLPQIGSTELLVIAAIALIVVGPKDLPMLLRKLGKFVGRLRGMATDFRSSFDEMARQSELDDLRKEVAAMRDSAAAEKSAVEQHLTGLEGQGFPGGEYEVFDETGEVVPYDPESYLRYPAEPESILTRRKRVAEVEGAPAKAPRKPKTTITAAETPAAKTAAPRKTAAKTPAKTGPKTTGKGKA